MPRRALGSPERVADHWRHALRRFTQLGVPEAAEVRTHLQELTGSARPADSW